MSDFSSPIEFPCDASSFFIPGPAGKLESLSNCPHDDSLQTLAIICHPHPVYGGTMQNKVVHTLDKTFNKMGVLTLRFNFRGVGKSTGEYSQGVGELDDLYAVVDWCQQRLPEHHLWLSGFSFGAYIVMKAAQVLDLTRLITVAPPVNSFDFSVLKAPPSPWLLVQGDADEVVNPQQVLQWAQQFNQLDTAILHGAGHFFHGRLNELQDIIRERLLT